MEKLLQGLTETLHSESCLPCFWNCELIAFSHAVVRQIISGHKLLWWCVEPCVCGEYISNMLLIFCYFQSRYGTICFHLISTTSHTYENLIKGRVRRRCMGNKMIGRDYNRTYTLNVTFIVYCCVIWLYMIRDYSVTGYYHISC